ncbi:metallopeptidase TldD-related protein [Brevibacillus sp. NRS-1366]|uniref:metallopeptidase TldD-related protein n=1 Tax=Brevibacillus sp. NRS-1366 TaxID=3233899 RepID=UPI003D1AF8BE
MLKKLQDLLSRCEYMIEVMWKQGELIYTDASNFHMPRVPTYHQGGRLIITDGNYEGNASFDSISNFSIALEEAKRKLSSRQFITTAIFNDRMSRKKIEDNYLPEPIPDVDTTSKLDELSDYLRCISDGLLVLNSTIDSSQFYYINSRGGEYVRKEYYSSIIMELIDSKRFDSINSISASSLAHHIDRIRPELVSLITRRERISKTIQAGEYPVLFSNSASGIFAHEVVGHMFEADTSTAQRLKSRTGEQVGPSFLSIGDHPIYSSDDEGVPTSETWMIREGRIEQLLHSRETARIYGGVSNGHGKAIYGWLKAIPRMNRTVIQKGEASRTELRSVFNRYIFVKKIDNAHSYLGSFVLHVGNAELMENGESICQLGKIIIRGDCMEALRNILLVGDQIKEHFFTCAKRGQNGLKVSSVSPEILVKSLWIGAS